MRLCSLFHQAVLVLAIAATAGVLPTQADSAAVRPNIMFILADDLGWSDLGCDGSRFHETPHLDRLAAAGVRFTQAYAASNVCSPTRASILTWRYPARVGITDWLPGRKSDPADRLRSPALPTHLALEETTLAEALRAAGYRTGYVGKWHLGEIPAHFPEAQGIDVNNGGSGKGHPPSYFSPHRLPNLPDGPPGEHLDDRLTREAIAFVSEAAAERQPVLLYLAHYSPHTPLHGKPELIAKYQAKLAAHAQPGPEIVQHPQDGAVRAVQSHATYAAMLESLDTSIGRLVAKLAELGLRENTIIIFTSDNGYFHMEHRRWDKRLAYEESLRIPMVVVYPGHIRAGSTISQLVTNADFAPTILSYAGLPVPPQMQGASMKPLFEEPNPRWRNAVFYEYWKELAHSIPAMTALRTDRYKLITYPEIKDLDELFDLEKDPHEMNNLAVNAAYADLHAAMKAQLEEAKILSGWSPNAFPKNFPRINGQEGVQLDLAVQDGALVDLAGSGVPFTPTNLHLHEGSANFDGTDASVRVPFHKAIDPAGWPFGLDLNVKPQSDGVIAVQSTPDYGYKVFIQDGRPGVAVHCKTWIDTTTVVDGPASILGKWTQLRVLIDYNRVVLLVNGQLAESVSLPLPFSGSPQTPLLIGQQGPHPVVEGVPDRPFIGQIKRFTIRRGL